MGSRRAWVLAIAALVVGLVVRVAVGGYGALERGKVAQGEGQLRVAVLEYRQALAWYLPVAPWGAEAGEALMRLGTESVAAERWEEAVLRLNMLRSGILGGRSLLGVDEAALGACDVLLSGALARWEAQAAREEHRASPGTVAGRTKHFAAVLAEDRLPSRAWGLLAVLGFFVWLGGAWRAAGAVGGRSPIRAWIGSAAGLVAFLVGVGLA